MLLPGDGEFARQWYYDQQDAETQALLDSGELEYPEHLAAATFTDTFALGDNTNISLNSDGSASFAQGHIKFNTNGRASFVEESSEAADGRTHFLISGAKQTAGNNESALSVKPTFITSDTGTLNAGNNCITTQPIKRTNDAFLISSYRAFGVSLEDGASVQNVVGYNADQSIINNATKAYGFFSNSIVFRS